jgi:hypothetical protein
MLKSLHKILKDLAQLLPLNVKCERARQRLERIDDWERNLIEASKKEIGLLISSVR